MKSKTGLIVLILLAFLEVTIASAQDCATADLSKDLNVICKEKDFNGFGLDPDWAEHARNGTFPLSDSKDACYQNPTLSKCTSETTSIDEARAPNLALCFFGCLNCIHGHVNWQPATFTGQIGWLNFADDWDFNFELLRDDQIGLAWNNAQVKLGGETRRIMELEFASSETVEKFTLIITSSQNWHEPGDGEVMAGADSSDLKPCDALTSVSKELNPISQRRRIAWTLSGQMNFANGCGPSKGEESRTPERPQFRSSSASTQDASIASTPRTRTK
jgi:hypothetical protein